MKTGVLIVLSFFQLTFLFAQSDQVSLVGDWEVRKITHSSPSDRMDSQYSFHVSIDSSGKISPRPNNVNTDSRYIILIDSAKCRMKWQYDYHVYRIDSLSPNYLRISITHSFEQEDPYELSPLGYDPNEPTGNNDVNSMLEIFIFERYQEE